MLLVASQSTETSGASISKPKGTNPPLSLTQDD